MFVDYVEYKNEKSIRSFFTFLNWEKLGKVYFSDYRNRKYSGSWLHVYYEHICYRYFWEKRMMFLHMIHKGHILRWI